MTHVIEYSNMKYVASQTINLCAFDELVARKGTKKFAAFTAEDDPKKTPFSLKFEFASKADKSIGLFLYNDAEKDVFVFLAHMEIRYSVSQRSLATREFKKRLIGNLEKKSMNSNYSSFCISYDIPREEKEKTHF